MSEEERDHFLGTFKRWKRQVLDWLCGDGRRVLRGRRSGGRPIDRCNRCRRRFAAARLGANMLRDYLSGRARAAMIMLMSSRE